MAKTAKTKLAKMESRRAAAAARARSAAKAAWQAQQHTLLAGGAALGIGFAENRGMQLPTIDAVDPAVLYAGLSFAASMFIRDRNMKRIAEGVTDGLLGVVAYKAGRYGFNTLFSYQKPVAAATAGVAGYGEEIVETGEF